MRYATFSSPENATPRVGVLVGNRLADLCALPAGAGTVPKTLLALLQAGPGEWQRLATLANDELSRSSAWARYPADEVQWHAPIPQPPKNIVCLGLNYVRHLRETTDPSKAVKLPEVPIFFTKAATSVNGPYDPVRWDRSVTNEVDYEVELGVVIGLRGKNIARGRAFEHVFGYTVVNDVSARDLQFGHKQWFKGKSLDGFCPMGPVIVTADEFGDPQQKRITLRVNGEVRQDASTADMLFPVDAIVESLSKGMTLEPGDIIATGTPEGVGLGRTPPVYLSDGDEMEAEVEGIGVLRNRIVAI
jgi:2-keto-4-pentenoate hydratase/2-oxohepta-3-ene-1,7-dioic acid hydratase in catechol pathway